MNSVCSKLINIWGLIITVLLALFLALFLIGFNRIWAGLQTMNEGTGAMLGAFLGLLAILAGAMFNAKLNRDRDERLYNQERQALAGGIKAELIVLKGLMKIHVSAHKNALDILSDYYENEPDEIEFEVDYNFQYQGIFFIKNAGKIHMLGSAITGALTFIHENITRFAEDDVLIESLEDHLQTTQSSINMKKWVLLIIDGTVDMLEKIEHGASNPIDTVTPFLNQISDTYSLDDSEFL